MANVKSAIKRARQNIKRRDRNQALRTTARSAAKKALDGIKAASTKEAAIIALREGERALQKAVSKGVWPKSRASRKVSRLAAAVTGRFA
ncbi:MAG TPA: 30S ribosomal protein S20 [Oligoflexia bacterium]|nr:30S ribosomal protein S20 [Oligoflexia bacterium]